VNPQVGQRVQDQSSRLGHRPTLATAF